MADTVGVIPSSPSWGWNIYHPEVLSAGYCLRHIIPFHQTVFLGDYTSLIALLGSQSQRLTNRHKESKAGLFASGWCQLCDSIHASAISGDQAQTIAQPRPPCSALSPCSTLLLSPFSRVGKAKEQRLSARGKVDLFLPRAYQMAYD